LVAAFFLAPLLFAAIAAAPLLPRAPFSLRRGGLFAAVVAAPAIAVASPVRIRAPFVTHRSVLPRSSRA
jgi:hypothetical protein